MAAVEFSTPGPGIGVITLNRPERMNAINREWIDDFHAICDALVNDRSAHAVVLTGAGKGFCSGFDLKAPHEFPEEPGGSAAAASPDFQERLASIPEKMLRAPRFSN